ncbi:MAG: nuclear transport factor 2 family protein [Solirubrobacterales bacterium]
MASNDVDVVREGFEALEEGGYEALLPLISPEFEVTTPAELASEPDTYRGPDGVRRYFESFYDAMDEITFTAREYELVGDRVVVDFTLRARGRSTGIEAEQRGFQVWQVRDGKAVRLEVFADRERAYEAARAGD